MDMHLFYRERKTYKCCHQYLDPHDYLCTAESSLVSTKWDPERECTVQVYDIILPAPALSGESRSKIESAIADALGEDCGCEHDCCDHWFGGTDAFCWFSYTSLRVVASYRPNI